MTKLPSQVSGWTSLDIGTVDTASDWVFPNFDMAKNKANNLETYAVKTELLDNDESF